MKRIFLTVSLLIVTIAGFAQVKANADVDQALKSIKAGVIKKDITYLADDKLKGRLPGTEGYKLAVDYVAAQLQTANVEPSGENGTYIQTLTLRKATVTSSSLQVSVNGKAEAYLAGKDYILSPDFQRTSTAVEAPVVFAGFGITAPEEKYDDYAGLDVKGKIVVIARGTPVKFGKTAALSYINPKTVLANALKHGAVGVLIASTDSLRSRPGGSNGTLFPNGKVASSGSYLEGIKLFGSISATRFNELLNSNGIDTAAVLPQLRKGQPASRQMSNTIKASYSSSYKDAVTYNVIGKVTGSDAKLRNEYVVHTAHLDHVGIGKPIEGDSIYNGAHDNASGSASLIQIGRLYANLKQKPKRSALFVFVTGEEMGLLGSAYFVKNPTVPLTSIVANINSDMPTIIAPFLSAVAIGSEHSSLANPVNQAGKYLNTDIENDPEPEQNRFIRSDQFSFISAGIPSIYVKYGNKTADGKHNLDATVKVWRAKYYHKPQDDINGIFDFDAGVAYSQFNFLIGYFVAQDAARPHWNEGSAFNKPIKQ